MRLIVAGSRDFVDYEYLSAVLDGVSTYVDTIEIVSGCARGADALGERFAEERGMEITRFPADWGTHGRAAGYIRNVEMADYADALIAFWDGKSRGTRHMIDIATKKALFVSVRRI